MLEKLFYFVNNTIKFIRKGGLVKVNFASLSKGEVLKGKRVLITGGTSGIGFSIAKKFIDEGAIVLITGRDIDRLKKAKNKLGENVHILLWDVSDYSKTYDLMNDAVQILSGIDILINNAGIYKPVPFFDVDISNWDIVMNTNLTGLFFMCQAAAKHMTNNLSGGKIINITSIRGFQGDVGPYGISKWGANGLTKGLARDLISKNIIVNGIAPGVTATEINGIDIHDNAFYGSEVKNGRIGFPQEIAEIALFLSSDAANNIVGQIIVSDGGATLI